MEKRVHFKDVNSVNIICSDFFDGAGDIVLSRFSTSRFLSHEQTFFAANTSYYAIISIT